MDYGWPGRRLDSAIFYAVDFVWEVIKRFLTKYRLKWREETKILQLLWKSVKPIEINHGPFGHTQKIANTFQYFFLQKWCMIIFQYLNTSSAICIFVKVFLQFSLEFFLLQILGQLIWFCMTSIPIYTTILHI